MRLLTRTSTFRFTIALSAPAVAVAAIAASGGLAGGAAARPISPRIAATSATLLSTQVTSAAASRHLGRNREIAWQMMYHRFPWRPKYQFRYVNRLWERESGWRGYAAHPYSRASRIPQAGRGGKRASAGCPRR